MKKIFESDFSEKYIPNIIYKINNCNPENYYSYLVSLIELLTLTIDIIGKRVVKYIPDIMNIFNNLFSIIPSCILTLSSIAFILQDKELITKSLEYIFDWLDKDESEEKIRLSLHAINNYLLSCQDIQEYLHKIVERMILLLTSGLNLEIIILCLDVMNSIHESYHIIFSPFYSRLITISKTIIHEIYKIDEENSEMLMVQILKMFQLYINDSIEQNSSFCFQKTKELSFEAFTQIPSLKITDELLFNTLNLLIKLSNNDPNDIQTFLISNNDLYEYLCKSKYSDNDEYFKTFQELMSIVNL